MSSTLAKYNSEENLRCLNNSYRQEEKTPTKRSAKTPKKTPKGDRFIPSHDLDTELNHYNLTKENADPNADITAETTQFNSALESTLFEGKTQSKILTFKDKAPAPKSHHQNSFHCLYAPVSGEEAPKKSHRAIPSTAFKVLDGPGMSDDYYLNLLDWSSSNILAVGLGSEVYVYNASTSEVSPLVSLPEDRIVTSVSWAKKGDYLAIGTDTGDVQMWDVEKQKKLRTLDGHSARVGAMSWNGFILSTGSLDTNIINHDVRAREHCVGLFAGHQQEVCGLKWSHDGSQLASGGNDNIVNIWDLNSHDATRPLFSLNQHTAAVKALAWCPFQPNTLATGGGTNDRTIRTWNTLTGACLTSTPTNSQVCQLVWSTNYRELVSSHGFSQNQLTIWKYPSMTRVADLLGHKCRVGQLALSPDGETIVSGSADETLRFWKVFQRDASAAPRAKATKEPAISLSNRTIR